MNSVSARLLPLSSTGGERQGREGLFSFGLRKASLCSRTRIGTIRALISPRPRSRFFNPFRRRRGRPIGSWAGLAIRLSTVSVMLAQALLAGEKPVFEAELVFPLETWHNHASCIIEAPNGDLLVCWFHGSGERTADDVKIEGARLKAGARQWGTRFTLADTPGFPDGNPCMFIDPQKRLWFIHTTILANTWESALLQVRVSSDYLREGPPIWESSNVLLIKPGREFDTEMAKRLHRYSTDKLYRRLGWMTRAHPFVLD